MKTLQRSVVSSDTNTSGQPPRAPYALKHTVSINVVGLSVASIGRPPGGHLGWIMRHFGRVGIVFGVRVRELGLLFGFDSFDPLLEDILAHALLKIVEATLEKLTSLVLLVQKEAGWRKTDVARVGI